MNNVYPLIQPPAADAGTQVLSARITGVRDGAFLTHHPGCPIAQRAFSCLLEPQAGDLVLLTQGRPGQAGYVLAVLEREGPQQADLTLPGGARLQAGDQQLRLQAKSLQLDAAESLSLHSSQLDVQAVSAQTTLKHWQGWFDTVQAHAVSVQYTAKTLSATLGRLLSRSLESFRSVQGLDETRAGRSSTIVRDHHQLSAGHITSKAQGFVKIDGQKIDLG